MQSLLLLLQDGRFHSGEELGELLGVSRAAVWKRLQHLQEIYGLALQRVPGKGYRLEEPLQLLDVESLRRATGLGDCLEVHMQIDSTNSQALRLLQRGSTTPLLVLAEQQLEGRGRRGRTWVSPLGQNLYFSLVWPVSSGLQGLDGLSLVVGLAVRRLLLELGVAAGLKWPNDVLVEERKISGILLELVGDPADRCHVVIGVGINLNMRGHDEARIDRPWTSVRLHSGKLVDRTACCALFYKLLTEYLLRLESEGFIGLRREWEEAHLWQGCEVTLSGGSGDVQGTVLGIDERGALRMAVEGREQVFSGGELSLRLKP